MNEWAAWGGAVSQVPWKFKFSANGLWNDGERIKSNTWYFSDVKSRKVYHENQN